MRAAVAIALLGLAARASEASDEELRARRLPLPQRLAAMEKAAADAAARKDAEGEAEFLVEQCFATVATTGDAKAPVCARAEKAAAGLPSELWLGRLRGYMSALVTDGAVELADEAERLSRRAGDDPRTAVAIGFAMLARGGAASQSGRDADVEREYASALELGHRTRDLRVIAQAETGLCDHRRRTGAFVEAAPACDRGLLAARDSGEPGQIAATLLARGALERDRGDRKLAVATWTQALAAADESALAVLGLTVRTELAQLLIQLGSLDEAATHVGAFEAAQQKRKVAGPLGFRLQLVSGQLAAARGDLRSAATSFVAAQASPNDGIVTQALVDEADARHRLGELPVAEERYRAAIARIEAAGARRDDRRASAHQRRLHAYRELVAVLWDRRGADAAIDALSVAEAARGRALAEALPAAAPARAPVAEVQKALPPGATLLMYVAGERRLFGFAVTRDRVAMAPLPGAGTRRDLEARVELFRRLLVTGAEPAELNGAGAALYRDLVAPVLGRAAGGTLVIAADGPLHLLPFEALSPRPGAYLVEDADVVMTPSATLLARAVPPASREGLLVVGPAPEEVDAIRAEVEGAAVLPDAGEQQLRAQASGAGVVHVATPAVIGDVVPLQSGLALAPGGGGPDGPDDDGWLRADEIYRMRLATALVVLASCRGGAGRVSASEGPMSLARAFLHAGVHTVIAALWDVDDREVLARGLYRELAAGLSIGAALSNAKRAAIRRGVPARAWAAWIAIGPATVAVALTPVPTPVDHRPAIIKWLVVFGLLAIAGAFAMGRWAR